MVAEGADVGTNLIDGHGRHQGIARGHGGCRRRHQPDRRTRTERQKARRQGKGADVGTNLIDGHFGKGLIETSKSGADVGTNLIDGHSNIGYNVSYKLLVPTSAPT